MIAEKNVSFPWVFLRKTKKNRSVYEVFCDKLALNGNSLDQKIGFIILLFSSSCKKTILCHYLNVQNYYFFNVHLKTVNKVGKEGFIHLCNNLMIIYLISRKKFTINKIFEAI